MLNFSKLKCSRLDYVILGIIILSVVHQLFFHYFCDYYTKPLINDTPITISPPGKIEADVYVPLSEYYHMEFNFLRKGDNYDEITEILTGEVIKRTADGKWLSSDLIQKTVSEPHTKIPFEVEIYDVSDPLFPKLYGKKKLVTVQRLLYMDLSKPVASAECEIGRFKLPKGSSKIIVKVNGDMPELSGISALIADERMDLEKKGNEISLSNAGEVAIISNQEYESDSNIILLLSGEKEKLRSIFTDEEYLQTCAGTFRYGSVDTGTPVQLSVKIYSVPDGRLVLEREINTIGESSCSKDNVSRSIDNFFIKEGHYKIIVQVIKDVPLFKTLEANIWMGIEYGIKQGYGKTWQMAYIFWYEILFWMFGGFMVGSIVVPNVIAVEVFILLCVLAYRCKKRLR